MSKRFNSLFTQLLDGLQSAEKRHRAAYGKASDNSDWDIADQESAIALRITNWRKMLDTIRVEIMDSSVVQDDDISIVEPPLPSAPVDVTSHLADHIMTSDHIITSDHIMTSNQQLSDILDGKSQNIALSSNLQVSPDSGAGANQTKITLPIKMSLPTKMSFRGSHYAISSWEMLYVKVCEILLMYCPYAIAILDTDTCLNDEQQTNFSYIQSEIRHRPKRLSNGLWIETGIDDEDIINHCHQLFERCGFSFEELQIEAVEV